MFKPIGIRSVLQLRNNAELESKKTIKTVPAGGDSFLESMVEDRIFIKDIEKDIENIRNWRNAQKNQLKTKLACNEAIAKVTVDEYLKYLNLLDEAEKQQREKILSKLKLHDLAAEIQIQGQGWNSSDTNLFEYLTASNKTVEDRKYELENQQTQLGTNAQAFINDLENISENILRREQNKPSQNLENKVVDRALLKKQLKEIDDQLKEIQELLKD